jgi:hypothetical protein
VIKKLSAGLCCAAIATLAVAGCSDSDDQVNAYAKKVCDQVQPQQATIQRATSAIASVSAAGNSPAQVQQTDSAAFGQIAGAYQTLAKAIQDAGAPPVDKGATLRKNAVTQLTGIASSYSKLQKTVQGLDASDQGKFADGLKTVSDQLVPLSQSSGDALTKLQAGDIGKAMAGQPGCRKASASASASAGPA